MRVYYADWQMECCGTPFAVGDEVAWRLVPAGEEDARYGATARVEHHGGPDAETVGRVRAIELVHQRYTVRTDPRVRERIDRALAADRPSDGPVLLPSPYTTEPVPGAHTLEPVAACPRWFEREDPGEGPGPRRIRRTTGALVTLDVTGTRPTRPENPAAPEPPGATPAEPGDCR
ncbi:DUF6578 domain-containing protein [Streptomyces sp. NPDC004658]|uniref:DUF6578 domain-containing protein n=1 Tax=Streptomyces sp. NPDC004658 TaxID=3154672 RepID=UPI0033B9EBF6